MPLTETGRLATLPYRAVGRGEPLLFLAGLSPVTGVPGGVTARSAAAQLRPFAREHRVIYLDRRPGLPRGMTLARLAAEYAAAVAALGHGPVDVLGLSTGGSIAQQLAADHPEAVRRLVLVSTGCRLGPAAREVQRRTAARVRRGARRRAFAVLAADLVPPGRGEAAAGLLGALLGPLLFPGRDALDDMATTIEAEDAFDLAALPAIGCPTLIVGSEADRYYPVELLRETAALIPRSRLVLLGGRGHVTVLGDPRYVREVRAFLAPGASRTG